MCQEHTSYIHLMNIMLMSFGPSTILTICFTKSEYKSKKKRRGKKKKNKNMKKELTLHTQHASNANLNLAFVFLIYFSVMSPSGSGEKRRRTKCHISNATATPMLPTHRLTGSLQWTALPRGHARSSDRPHPALAASWACLPDGVGKNGIDRRRLSGIQNIQVGSKPWIFRFRVLLSWEVRLD